MYRYAVKRILDLIISILGLPFFCVLFLIIAPAIIITDKGPVFYNAKRLGKNGKIFNMYKFRSMKVNAPDIRNADGSTFNGENDPRVTKIGKFIRKTSIDETPQLLNVLKGDMSIIGPRAFLATTHLTFEEMDEKRQKRLTVKPGITGYSQAYFRNSITLDEKIENDCYYVDNISFIMDVRVIFKTIVSVIKHDNIYIENTDKKVR